MLMHRFHKRVSKFCKMIVQLNQNFILPPVVHGNPLSMQKPSFISLRARCFCASRLTSSPTKVSLADSIQSPKVSRLSRTEAQEALFDYLHCTRSFNFTDAEHISKNSPHFLHSLLSRVDSEKDVARTVTKFLRYNPINEFEPFFESLGLNPSEFSSLLPRNLMFLSDDEVMLENFHVLCGYGIPRSKMGKMYKEAKDIFGYDYGVLALKLQDYENLGLSKSVVIKLVSCCPSLLVGRVNGEFVKVLQKLKGLGVENDWIGGCLSVRSIYNWKRIIDTMDILERVGYTEKQMSNLFKTNPALLFGDSGKQVHVLFGRLLKLGLKMNEVYKLLIQNPQFLSGKCVKNILRAVDFLFDIRMETEDISTIVFSHMQLLSLCSLKGPKTVCKDLKVEKNRLCQIIKEDPPKLFILASKLDIKSHEHVPSQISSKQLDKTSFLLRLGFIENSDEMTKALRQFRGRGDQLQERFDCLVQAGLDCNVVTNIIKQAPMVLNQSKDVIEKKIDCLKECLDYPLDAVVAFPTYLCYDVQRINRRFSMYLWLRERGAAKPMLSLSTLLACSDTRFVKYFVDVHPEGPAMWENLKETSLQANS